MHPTKSPGPDCMSPIFFVQKYWHIISKEVYNIILNILNHDKNPTDLNQTFIPKFKDHPHSLSQFRPISLCNVIFKLVTKA